LLLLLLFLLLLWLLVVVVTMALFHIRVVWLSRFGGWCFLLEVVVAVVVAVVTASAVDIFAAAVDLLQVCV